MRWAPEIPFPPYTYIPGQSAHPVSDRQGHSFGRVETHPEPIDPAQWREHRQYLFAVDLFNHGFYWESHEAWEGLWIAAQGAQPTTDFLKGLIKLAAAMVKRSEGNEVGVRRHAARAAELFRLAHAVCPTDSVRFLGLSWENVAALAEQLPTESNAPVLELK